MKISIAKDLEDLLDIKYKELISKAQNASTESIKSDYKRALKKTFGSVYYNQSVAITELLKLDDLYLYSIMNSIHAVNNSIGVIWERIHKESILITDKLAFDYTIKMFPEFKQSKPKFICDISEMLTANKVRGLIEQCSEDHEIKYIVSLGGGRVMDIQKFIGYKSKKNMIAFPTSLASHVYASPKIHALPVIKEFGYNLTIDGDPPHISFLDMKLLNQLYNENPRLIFAGLGDISAFITAKHDWILSKSNNLSERNYFVESLIEDVITWLKDFSSDMPFELWVKEYHMIQALLCNITDWEGSAPASGSEHLFALSVEDYTSNSLPLHGELVALGVIIMSAVQKNDFANIAKIIEGLGLPNKLSDIGIDKNIIIESFKESLAKGKAKNRYTVLNEISDPEEVIRKIMDQLFVNNIIQE
jgi:glycerol-1-phosphate dehydrogenase [NAD(P)+]